ASENIVQLIHQKEFYHWTHWRAKHPQPNEDDGEHGGKRSDGLVMGVGFDHAELLSMMKRAGMTSGGGGGDGDGNDGGVEGGQQQQQQQ
ncbi:hypothetical protein HDU76_011668, partial [Blyttiomyces sp. JEL0837]